MKKSRFLLIAGIILIIILLMMAYYYYSIQGEENKEKVSVSVIVYGEDTERWENLRRGAEQAAEKISDEGTFVEVNLMTTMSERDAQEQIYLIQREIKRGADALIIASCNYVAVKEYFETIDRSIPVIFVESGIGENSDYQFVSADNYKMGYSLGEEILKKEISKVKIAVIEDGTNRDSLLERKRGLQDALQEKISKIVTWKRSKNEENIQTMLFLQRELTEEAVDVVVALDNTSTEAIVSAVQNLNKDVKIYAIANTEMAIYHLDNKTIESMVVQNEFSMGYIAIEQLMKHSEYADEELKNHVTFIAVDKRRLYLKKNQKLLFPFVK
ncbi:MAG: substrate-binding domain-containing protein [Clostridia bacterium]|nr:substrate-binding domain-containing protein [Clostridia bacterium]